MIEEFEKRGIDAIVTQTGCMGYCYAEPTIEVKVPGKDPIVFGFVTIRKPMKSSKSTLKSENW